MKPQPDEKATNAVPGEETDTGTIFDDKDSPSRDKMYKEDELEEKDEGITREEDEDIDIEAQDVKKLTRADPILY